MNKVICKVVKFGTIKHFVLKFELFLVNLINLFYKVGLPTEKFDCLDIVESLVDVKGSLFTLSALLFANILLRLASGILRKHIQRREEQDDKATVANLLENNG